MNVFVKKKRLKKSTTFFDFYRATVMLNASRYAPVVTFKM